MEGEPEACRGKCNLRVANARKPVARDVDEMGERALEPPRETHVERDVRGEALKRAPLDSETEGLTVRSAPASAGEILALDGLVRALENCLEPCVLREPNPPADARVQTHQRIDRSSRKKAELSERIAERALFKP